LAPRKINVTEDNTQDFWQLSIENVPDLQQPPTAHFYAKNKNCHAGIQTT